MEFLQQIVYMLQHIPDGTWHAIGAGLGISVVVQAIKHWVEGLSDKTVVTVLAGLSFLASAVEYLLSAAVQNPTVLGQETATFIGIATLSYRFFVKPIYTLFKDAKDYRDREAAVGKESELTKSEMPAYLHEDDEKPALAAPAVATPKPSNEADF